MSLKRTQAVVCDVQGDRCEQSVAECSMSAREARKAAADAGWWRQGDDDVCPACVHRSQQPED
jgi:hypothetical protein